jgi:hypothetical protein
MSTRLRFNVAMRIASHLNCTRVTLLFASSSAAGTIDLHGDVQSFYRLIPVSYGCLQMRHQ